ncbi:MAG: nickel ABC transporter permease [Candidatus Binatia bacterium]
MRSYLLRRLILLWPTFLGAVTLVFLFIHLLPGDPVEIMLGETASAVDKEALRRQLGLDRPLWKQYADFIGGLFQGDLGRSLYEDSAVIDLIAARLPATLELTLGAMTVAILIALPLGIVSAVRKNSWLDRSALAVSLLGVAMPSFWLGPLLILFFSIDLGFLPVSGRGGLSYLILPAFTLGSGLAAILTRMIRSALLDTIDEDYIRAARAKGLSEYAVWGRHALGNALLPVVTVIGLQFGALLAGSIITETIFAWPGLGRLTIQAIQTRDYPLVQGCILCISLGYILVNLATDILYTFIDPRIRYES